MSLIERDSIDGRYDFVIQTVARQLLKGRCVLFLGAGASIGSGPGSLPTAQKLSQDLAADCKLDWHKYILLSTIAFYYESFFNRQLLNELLVQKIGRTDIPCPKTIELLMDLLVILEDRNLRTLAITTNYDRHFERAYERKRRSPPGIVIYKGGWDPNDHTVTLHSNSSGEPVWISWMPSVRTNLYKMHGCISQVTGHSLVVTEEDYINFLTNALGEYPDNRLLWYVRSQLDTSMVLFLGYSLSDWNFRAIFKATVEKRQNKDIRSYAVQLHEPPLPGERSLLAPMVDFWHEKRVDIVNVKADQFVEDLLKVVLPESSVEEVNAATASH